MIDNGLHLGTKQGIGHLKLNQKKLIIGETADNQAIWLFPPTKMIHCSEWFTIKYKFSKIDKK